MPRRACGTEIKSGPSSFSPPPPSNSTSSLTHTHTFVTLVEFSFPALPIASFSARHCFLDTRSSIEFFLRPLLSSLHFRYSPFIAPFGKLEASADEAVAVRSGAATAAHFLPSIVTGDPTERWVASVPSSSSVGLSGRRKKRPFTSPPPSVVTGRLRLSVPPPAACELQPGSDALINRLSKCRAGTHTRGPSEISPSHCPSSPVLSAFIRLHALHSSPLNAWLSRCPKKKKKSKKEMLMAVSAPWGSSLPNTDSEQRLDAFSDELFLLFQPLAGQIQQRVADSGLS